MSGKRCTAHGKTLIINYIFSCEHFICTVSYLMFLPFSPFKHFHSCCSGDRIKMVMPHIFTSFDQITDQQLFDCPTHAAVPGSRFLIFTYFCPLIYLILHSFRWFAHYPGNGLQVHPPLLFGTLVFYIYQFGPI